MSGAPTQALLAFHRRAMRDGSPPEHSFALDLDGLKAPGITVWSAWDGDAIVGVGALKMHGAGQGEIKSMRTHPDHLRRGAGAAMLEHMIAQAAARGVTRLSLETGSGDASEPALALYRRRGFANGPAFADYAPSAFNQFLHHDLSVDRTGPMALSAGEEHP